MPITINRDLGASREFWANSVTQLVGATRYGPFYPGQFTRVKAVIERETSVGAETMDCKMQTTDPTGDFMDVLDHAGAAIAFVQWADDSHIVKTLEVGVGIHTGDADDTITFGTNHKGYNVSLPQEFYWLVTGASGTSDTFSAYHDFLP